MTHRSSLATLGIVAVASWTALSLVLFKLDPCIAPGTRELCHAVSTRSLLLFFTSATFALTSLFTLLGFYLRVWLSRDTGDISNFGVSIRQGILLTICAIGALGLLLLEALTWWSGLLLIAIVLLMETYFTYESERN